MGGEENRTRFDPSPERVAAVPRFLPLLEAEGFSAGEWEGGQVISRTEQAGRILQMSHYDYSPVVSELVRALYEGGWIRSFDWPAWQATAARYARHPDLVQRARFTTLVRLLTTHVRKDRFCEGHLAAMIGIGHIAEILRRLQELRGGATAQAAVRFGDETDRCVG